MDSMVEIELNGVPVKWNLEQGTFTFFGIKSALFWLNPSLLSMLQPLADEIGQDLFRLLIAHSASQGTEEDYQNMVSVLGNTFEEGFANWGKAVASAGWGVFEIIDFDEQNKTARVRVSNAWELLLGNASMQRWGCPFTQGKLIGIFSQAFQETCWADEVDLSYDPEKAYIELAIHTSQKTITAEIESLRQAHMQQQEVQLSNEIKKKTQALHDSENRFRQLAEVSSDWVWEMDEHLRFSYFSSEYFNFERLGFDTKIAIGKTRQDLISEEELEKPQWKNHLSDLENRREFRDFQYKLITPDGTRHHFQINGVPVYDEEGKFAGYRGTGTDLTEKMEFVESLEAAKKEAEKNLEKVSDLNLQLQTEVAHRNQALSRLNSMSQLDYLTETLNRVQLKENIQKFLADKETVDQLCGLLFITLLDIEQINFQYGLETGDAVLVETALLIQDEVGPGDMVARSSGAEFIVFLPACEARKDAEELARRISVAISGEQEILPEVHLQARVGVITFDDGAESAEALLSQSYNLMCKAKAAGEAVLVEAL